jgi:hypothetical protein
MGDLVSDNFSKASITVPVLEPICSSEMAAVFSNASCSRSIASSCCVYRGLHMQHARKETTAGDMQRLNIDMG